MASQAASDDIRKWKAVIKETDANFLKVLPRWPGNPASVGRLPGPLLEAVAAASPAPGYARAPPAHSVPVNRQ